MILAGRVVVEGLAAPKAGAMVPEAVRVTLKESPPFVSRGGEKLAAFLARCAVDLRGAHLLDVGASTGGFTDCLLQRGAAKVFAVDVGQGQLAWKLRSDPRVVVMEKTNARFLKPENFPAPADLLVVDCSFISLKKILPPAVSHDPKFAEQFAHEARALAKANRGDTALV